MFNLKKEKYIRRSPGKNIAFYISLALCISAVAGAAWNTYGSVEEYSASDEAEQPSKAESSVLEAAKEVSGEDYPEKADESSALEKEESKAQSSDEKPSEKPSQESGRTYKPISKGDIIKTYSPEKPVYSETMKDWRTHNGIDISGAEGASVHAVESGIVSEIKQDPLLGNIICIKSSDHELSYCGMTNVSVVEEGVHVMAGETIGYIGTIPSEQNDEPHLHLEAFAGGEHIDPASLF